jgi:DNA-binding response OmpR family regulator
MEPLLVFPDPVPPEIAQGLDLGGYPWKAVSSAEAAARLEPEDGWAGAVVCADGDPEAAFALCRSLRKRDIPLEPVLLAIDGSQVNDLELREDLFDDFVLTPSRSSELDARLKHLFFRTGRGTRPELIEYGPLALNLETYQAVCSGKVFTRETLLSRVWGYDYYGGARTVDVHIRRLRAKLGEEHANLISTVRSVGYRFGETRWGG